MTSSDLITTRQGSAPYDSVVTFKNSQGVAARGTVIRLTRADIIFEVYNPYSIVQLSEVLHEVQVRRKDRTIYHGRAMVSSLVSTGLVVLVSASLVDPWSDFAGLSPREGLTVETQRFVEDWTSGHSIRPPYQLVVSTIRNFLSELSRWLQEAEMTISDRVERSERPNELAKDLLEEIKVGVDPKMHELFERFEYEAAQVSEDELAVHRAFACRELHPLTMCSPIVHRTFTKPLGYAGDYAMVDMIVGEPALGANTYAKLINIFNVSTPPAVAHRNRIGMLLEHIEAEARRVSSEGRPFRVLNIGCGPALEVQRFITENELASRSEFTLMDFSEETLDHARAKLDEAQRESGRTLKVEYKNQSIHALLKEALQKRRGPEKTYDLIYCAGLFDYLSDRICKRLMQLFHHWTDGGGLVLATNVHPRNPVRHYMEHVLEWYLIHRDEREMGALAPKQSHYELETDETGVNVFLRVRKEV